MPRSFFYSPLTRPAANRQISHRSRSFSHRSTSFLIAALYCSFICTSHFALYNYRIFLFHFVGFALRILSDFAIIFFSNNFRPPLPLFPSHRWFCLWRRVSLMAPHHCFNLPVSPFVLPWYHSFIWYTIPFLCHLVCKLRSTLHFYVQYFQL